MKMLKAAMPMLGMALAACTHPADVSRPLTEAPDKNATFAVNETPTGFTVEVRYSRYQFVPEQGALLAACKSLVTARAYEEAKRQGRTIEPINELSCCRFRGHEVRLHALAARSPWG